MNFGGKKGWILISDLEVTQSFAKHLILCHGIMVDLIVIMFAKSAPENSGEVGEGNRGLMWWLNGHIPPHVRNGTHCTAISKNIRDLNERLFFFFLNAALFSPVQHIINIMSMAEYKMKRDACRPKVLDKYEIIGFISSGTYGRVYKARSRNK